MYSARQYFKAHVHPKTLHAVLILTQTQNQKIASKSHVPKAHSKFQQIKTLYLTVEPFHDTQTQAQSLFWVNFRNTQQCFDRKILYQLLRAQTFINSTI